MDVPRNCQDRRNQGKVIDEAWIVDPDGKNGPNPPFTAYCDMSDDATVGATVITVQNVGCQVTIYTYISNIV